MTDNQRRRTDPQHPHSLHSRTLWCVFLFVFSMVSGCSASETSLPASDKNGIALYRLKGPGSAYDLEQASGLCYGKVGKREGLWVVCDRHGGTASGRIHFYSRTTLENAKPGEDLVADDALRIIPPQRGWVAFTGAFQGAGSELLTELRRRVPPDDGMDHVGQALDLEGITIGRRHKDDADCLFVANEEPHSSILELRLVKEEGVELAEIAGVYRYAERKGESGSDRNDGLEGLAYSGTPGMFYWAEEGTVFHNGAPGPRLFFLDPRLERGRLDEGVAKPDEEMTLKLTTQARRQRDGRMQTLNALTMTPDGHLAAVDRNGGWVLRIDPRTGEATRWLNLYDLNGVNLRETLAEFPGTRRMPYISIEGIAFDPAGTLWLVDDPAMPENFRHSCLIRIALPSTEN